MEHLRADGMEFLICGAGGAKLRQVHRARPQSVFHATTFGFLDIHVDQHKLTADFLDTKLDSLEKPGMQISK